MSSMRITIEGELERAVEALTQAAASMPIPAVDVNTPTTSSIANIAVQALYAHVEGGNVLDGDTLRHLADTYHTVVAHPGIGTNIWVSDANEERIKVLAEGWRELPELKGYRVFVGRGYNRTLVYSIALGWLHEHLDTFIEAWCSAR